MIKPRPEKEAKSIVKNIVAVLDSGNIELLTKASYQYLSSCVGFIAHYNLQGFKDEYRETGRLRRHLEKFKSMNQWENFTPKDPMYNFQMQKKEIYNSILQGVNGE